MSCGDFVVGAAELEAADGLGGFVLEVDGGAEAGEVETGGAEAGGVEADERRADGDAGDAVAGGEDVGEGDESHGCASVPGLRAAVRKDYLTIGKEVLTWQLATLTVTAKGQVTLRKEVLKHLGVQPGDKVVLDLLPGGEVKVHAARPKRSWDEISGFLKGKTTKVASLEEINDAIEKGWAGQL